MDKVTHRVTSTEDTGAAGTAGTKPMGCGGSTWAAEMLERFNAFRQSIGNQDPQAMVQELLRSGRMTQEQYQQLAQMARQLSGIIR